MKKGYIDKKDEMKAIKKISSIKDAYDFMDKYMSEKRKSHILGVVKMSIKLSKIYGADIKKAEIAAKTHDMVKEIDIDNLNDLVNEFKIDDYYLNNKNLSHSKVASMILKEQIGADQDVIDAVSFHTTGRKDMSLLEKIIFLSDAIEENRKYDGVEHIRDLALEDIDRACLKVLENTVGYLRKMNVKLIDKDSIDALTWLKSVTEKSEKERVKYEY